MMAQEVAINNLNDLRHFVIQTLCSHEQLEIDAFPVTERILVRAGRPCGIFFCLHGPRSVKFTAIWESEKNSVLFYGSSGERYHKLVLAEGPALTADRLLTTAA